MADIYSIPMFIAEALVASGTATSDVIPLSAYQPLGNFASQLEITGSGTVDVDLYTSLNGEDFILSRNLFNDYAVGEYIEGHGMEVATHFYLVITETSTTDTVTVSLWTGIQ
jgi:hypothetical protein